MKIPNSKQFFTPAILRSKLKNPTNKNNFRIIIMIDESLSMMNHKTAAIDEINRFVNQQKNIYRNNNISGNNMRPPSYSLVKFNIFSSIIEEKSILDAIFLTQDQYNPKHSTAFYDNFSDILKKYQSESNNLCFVISDGKENCSVRVGRSEIAELVKKMEKENNWHFSFKGGFDEAEDFSREINIEQSRTFESTFRGYREAFSQVSCEANIYSSRMSSLNSTNTTSTSASGSVTFGSSGQNSKSNSNVNTISSSSNPNNSTKQSDFRRFIGSFRRMSNLFFKTKRTASSNNLLLENMNFH